MREVSVRDAETGEELCPRCQVADTFWTRFRGLQLRPPLAVGDGLLLRPAGSIHTFFMRFAIDAVFCDGDLRVLDVREGLRPWRAASVRGAKAVLELPAGHARRTGLRRGRRLVLEAAGQAP
jgi:uncharacterized protein